MAKLTLIDATTLQDLVAAVNANSTATETALENTLSRDGTSPNEMEASLDMNSNRILNLQDPDSAQEPVTLSFLEGFTITEAGEIATTGSSTDNALVRWSGTGGNSLKDSPIVVTDACNITGVGTLASGAITSSGNISGVNITGSGTTSGVGLTSVISGSYAPLNLVRSDIHGSGAFIGSVDALGRDSDTNVETYGQYAMWVADDTGGSEDSYWEWFTRTAGALATRFKLGPGFSYSAGTDQGAGSINGLGVYDTGNRVLTTVGGQTITTGGFAHTSINDGSKSTGTFTPEFTGGNVRRYTNDGAHTLAPPSGEGTMVIQVTNGASAGAITTSGFTKVTGDAHTTTNGDDFLFDIRVINGFSQLHITALQ